MDRERAFMKVVYEGDVPRLLARTRKDIEEADCGRIMYQRPLVFFGSAQESVEKGLWLYTKNILPLIAEEHVDITCMAAARYGIDAILGDIASLKKMEEAVSRYPDLAKVAYLVVADMRDEPGCSKFLKQAFPAATLQRIPLCEP